MSVSSKGIRALLVAMVVAAAMICVPAFAWAADDDAALKATTVKDTAKDTAKEKKTAALPSGAFVKQTVNMKTKTATGRVIPNGTYIIASANDAQKLVGVRSNKRAAGAALTLQPQGGKSQIWNIEYNTSSQTYIITNVFTKKALATNGKTVFQAKPCTPGSKGYLKQRWLISSHGTGYSITSAYNKKVCLEVAGKDNARVKLRSAKVKADQRFWLFRAYRWLATQTIKNGTYSIKSAAGDYMLQVRRASTATNAIFQLGKKTTGNLNQMYNIKRVTGSNYRIVDVNSGLALTAVGNKTVQRKVNSSKAQLWVPLLNEDGSVTFKNAKTGKVLGLATPKAKNLASTAMTKLADEVADTQKWILSPTTTGMDLLQERAFERVVKEGSSTNYSIAVDLTAHKLMIFKRDKKSAPWKPFKSWMVSNGIHKSTREFIGTKSQFRYTNPESKGYSAYYWSRMGGQQYFHSIIYRPGTHSVSDGHLGRSISNGCVRMSLENAKYIYYEIPSGTKVQRYY